MNIMNSRIRGILAVMVLAVLVLLAHTEPVSARVKSGTLGEKKGNIQKWSYDTKTKVLTIEGKGWMEEYITTGWDQYASKVKKIVVKGSIKNLYGACFWGFDEVESVVLTDTIEEIGYNAFDDTRKLKKITLPKNLKKIDSYAFSGSGIEEVVIPDGVTVIEEYAFEDGNFRKVKLGRKTKILKSAAFSGNEKLSDIALPDTMESIQKYAFSYCGLKTVTIPKNVREIGNAAFLKNRKLKKMVIKSHKIEKWGEDIFYGNEQKIKVVVPKEKYEEYKKKIQESGAGKNVKVVASGKW